MADNPLNAVNRGVYISDNLPFLRSLNDGCVDLVCIDPPFGKKQTFEGKLKPPLSADERRIERELMESWDVYDAATAYEAGLEYPDQSGTTARFRDIWAFERLFDEDWWTWLEGEFPAGYWLIQATRYSHGDSTAAYIGFMLERMLEIKRVLKPTGSVYLHCDHEANAYLRQLMDAVFGPGNFRNEIIWKRTSRGFKGSQHAPKSYNSNADTILFYSRGQEAHLHTERVLEPYEAGYLSSFRFQDEKGPYYRDEPFRRPSAGPRPNLCYEYKGFYPPNPTGWQMKRERLQELDDAGEIEIVDGRIWRKIRPKEGRIRNSLWDDINEAKGHERTGYPTQKPQALARRIIEASSNSGDVVLDCFAGCAYVPVAAELTGRQWIACDMSPRAWTVVRRQFHKQDSLRIKTEGDISYDEPLQFRLDDDRIVAVRGPNELPSRDTPEQAPLPGRKLSVTVKYRQQPLETSRQIWEAFVAQYGPECWYCGRLMSADRRELHLDHVEPNRRDGSNDDCWNRALACSPCNSDKSGNPDLERVFAKALEGGRISSPAKREEVRSTFEARRRWARERWESIPKQQPMAGVAA